MCNNSTHPPFFFVIKLSNKTLNMKNATLIVLGDGAHNDYINFKQYYDDHFVIMEAGQNHTPISLSIPKTKRAIILCSLGGRTTHAIEFLIMYFHQEGIQCSVVGTTPFFSEGGRKVSLANHTCMQIAPIVNNLCTVSLQEESNKMLGEILEKFFYHVAQLLQRKIEAITQEE